MMLKLLGAICVVVSCGGFGFSVAFRHRMDEKTLRQLLSSLDYLENELLYRLTPLPSLCRKTADLCPGKTGDFYRKLASELEGQASPNVEICFRHALASSNLPPETAAVLENLGTSLGKFDLEGQIRGIIAVREQGKLVLSRMERDGIQRIRSYQTLGICTGAALAIILV